MLSRVGGTCESHMLFHQCHSENGNRVSAPGPGSHFRELQVPTIHQTQVALKAATSTDPRSSYPTKVLSMTDSPGLPRTMPTTASATSPKQHRYPRPTPSSAPGIPPGWPWCRAPQNTLTMPATHPVSHTTRQKKSTQKLSYTRPFLQDQK